ncbi:MULTISPECIES: ATP-grasp domain-containing protein [unclassified Burkholderia]|uniref:ATP-grasp domain-containing protein n=1 Tax=unclassified Burkholderia TaxID=2613784 RepID=UPI000758A66F|nr:MULTISPECIES: ATP-grasp domain-containing protein [unclassified Burkholderia]KVN06767.1 biotin carboxylase [Burkholderia sp. MSMB1552]KWZ50011.1 biotin carboxylase [Burkholderia sp. MSMB1588]
MASTGVLILSHCGFSFAEDLIAAIHARGLQAYVLSSKPLPEHGDARLQALRDKAEAVLSADSHVLAENDVLHAIAALRESNAAVIACVSVWEGYRALMALANASLDVSDVPAKRIAALRDKHFVRNALQRAELSRSGARLLTPESLDVLKRDGRAYFVKPARGIASYGAFRLTADTTWSTLADIATRARDDTVYASALGDDIAFIAEDYVAGIEFSFEALTVNGETFVVAIHEKCQLTEANGTVLEDSCTSPPVSISAAGIAAGIDWLRAVLAHFSLDWGCFHVEARFDGDRWDLIEINPRIGGSLISPSVGALNEEANLLELWLDLLLAQTKERANPSFRDTLARLAYTANGTPPTANATFFRVYFAAPGHIDRIEIRPLSRPPALTHILLKAGDVVEQASREVFLGQLLWHMTRDAQKAELPALLAESANAIDVHYHSSSIALEA